MERWTGRVAVVTGTSAGIGAAIAYQLQDHGLHVVALARREEKIAEAVSKAREEAKTRNRYQPSKVPAGKLYPRKCDVQKEEDILATFKWVAETLGRVDILVNNAGVGGEASIAECPTEEWTRILNTNVLGLSICTREAVKIMRSKGVNDGHIVHISSVAGHLPTMSGKGAMYAASKHAVRALTEGLRKDFVEHKENIKITSVSPGVVHTDIVNTSPRIDREFFLSLPYLNSEDVADAVTYAISTPPHVQIHEIIIKPVGEPF
ncbi:farnesol dehydrogenase-like isoform X1 [Anabrus simplex]|uniref:farnesol dehydrogenase-like isoform X1 n=1 Tax=Anabrus simplex TaxID=316456 RepID=UPI0035A29D6B